MSDYDAPPDLPETIAGVPPEQVAEEGAPDGTDPATRQLLIAESSYLRAWRARTGRETESEQATGVAFSGGGVRSAAFALGVLQVLAGRRMLERIDYLSSVSGGGFASGSLVWLLRQASNGRFGLGPGDFPFGAETDDDDTSSTRAPMLNFLRQHGAYLTPGHGITLTSTVAVVLRGILLNLVVWMPILVALMLALLIGSGVVGSLTGAQQDVPSAFRALLWIAIGCGVLFLIGSLVYSFSTEKSWHARKQRYLLHRLYETHTPWILWPMLGAATLATLPWAAAASFGWIGQFGGAAFVVIGLAIGLWSFLRPDASWGMAFVRKRALPLGALSALYGVLLLAYQSASWLYAEGGTLARTLAAVLLITALLSGRFVNLNYISIQRYYRDRLMEAFMPDIDRGLDGRGGPAARADGQRLSDCLDPAAPTSPYPLFNSHLPLASARSRRRRLRGGDNFILSPLYCGSTATGWRRTDSFMNDGMTLPTAMAISGSVNHQQSGLGGIGLALNPLVSMLKVLLNLRMGYWVPNPCKDDQSRRPDHFNPGLEEALAVGRDEEQPFLLLEDGGYFDNLGLYELVRRRLRLIVVCDAGADAGDWLTDLYQVIRLVKVDFGTRVSFDDEAGFAGVIPSEPASYPTSARLAQRGYLLARLDYADGSHGTLIYLKSVLVPGLDFSELGFGSRREGFPQESTIDQFFDEEQFDAHRRLGCELARQMVDDTDLAQRLRDD